MKKIFICLAAAVTAISCNVDSLSDATPSVDGQGKIVVSLTTPAATTSRVDVADNGNGGYAVTWSEGDALGGWCDAIYNNDSFNKFSMVAGSYSAEEASFEGTISYVDALDKVRFVYPYSPSISLYNKDNTVGNYTNYMNAFDISLAKQSAKADLSHLDATTYMVSDALVAPTGDDDFESTSLAMRHIGAAMDLRLKLDNAAGYTLTNIVVSGMPSEASINLLKEIDDEDFMVLNTQSSDITIAVDSFEAADDIYSVVFNILPFALEAGDAISVVATFVDADDVVYTAEGSFEATAAVEFARATRNYFGVTLGELSDSTVVAPDVLSVVTLNKTVLGLGAYVKTDTNATVDDCDFIWYYMGCFDSSSMQFYKSAGYIYNTSALSSLSKVVVTKKSGGNNNLTLYAGSSSKPTTGAVTPTVSGDVSTYEIPAGSTHFNLQNGSGASNILSIEIYY